MKTKLSDLASIAEIVGAFAVVVSLIYVGVQVNDSTRAVRSASANDANVAVQSWYLMMGSEGDTASSFYRSLMSDEPLSDEEEFLFIVVFQGAFLGFQNSYLLVEEGTIDPELNAGLTGAVLMIKDTPGFKRYWPQRRDTFHPAFVRYVDQLILQDAETPMELYRTKD